MFLMANPQTAPPSKGRTRFTKTTISPRLFCQQQTTACILSCDKSCGHSRQLKGDIPDYVNIGTGEDISIRELAFMIKDIN